MKKIFICVPNRHKEKTRLLAKKLEDAGFSVTYAAEFTNQSLGKNEIFASNMKLIRESDIFVAYFVDDGHYGIDFATEVGKVSEMDKPVIGYVDLNEERTAELKDKLEKDIMFKHSFDSFAWTFEELMDRVNEQ